MPENVFASEQINNVVGLFVFSNYYNEDGEHTDLVKKLKRFRENGDEEVLDTINEHFYNWLQDLIYKHDIDCICFVPNTQKRKRNLFDELRVKLEESFPVVDLINKKHGDFPGTKEVISLVDKEKLANSKFEDSDYTSDLLGGNILVIDDIVGSGSTIKAVSNLIKRKNPRSKIFVAGLAR